MNTIKDAKTAVELAKKIEVMSTAVTALDAATKPVLVTIHLGHNIYVDLDPDTIKLFSQALNRKITHLNTRLEELGFKF